MRAQSAQGSQLREPPSQDGDDAESLGFVLRRGFVEIARDVEQVRELGDEEPPGPPAGIALSELEPEHLEGVYAVAVEATPDMAISAAIEAAGRRPA